MTELLDSKYEIIAVLAENAMSTVYQARHVEMDRLVAAKVMRPELASDERAFQRFRQEIRTVTSFTHQNIVAVLDCGICPDGRPYLIMELLQGSTLSQLIKERGGLDWTDAVEIFHQIAEALAYAHNAGIIHRDIKPSNIFVLPETPRPRVVVIDFGIAAMTVDQTTGSNPALTADGAVIGTTLYMSPEQCTGQRIDSRSDLYSLGCLMYETLTGAPPFCHDSALATMNSHVCDKPKPPKAPEGKLAIPAVVSAIVLQALEKKPSRRQHSAAALDAQLSGLLSESGRHNIFIKNIPQWFRISPVAAIVSSIGAILTVTFVLSRTLPVPAPAAQATLVDESTWNHVQQLPPRYFHNYKEVGRLLRSYSNWDGHQLRLYGYLMSRRLVEETSRHFGPDSKEHIRALAVQAHIYRSCGNATGTIQLLRQVAPKLAASQDPEDQIELHGVLVDLANLLPRAQIDESISLLKQAQVLSKDMSLSKQVDILKILAFQYWQKAGDSRSRGEHLQMKSNCLESMRYADQGLELMGEACSSLHSGLIEDKANCSFYLGRYKEALNYYRRNIEDMEQSGMIKNLPTFYINSMAGLASSALALGDLKLAANTSDELFAEPDELTDINLPTMREAAVNYSAIAKAMKNPAEVARSQRLYARYNQRLLDRAAPKVGHN